MRHFYLAALVSCTHSDPKTPSQTSTKTFFSDDSLGFEIQGFDWSDAEVSDGDGDGDEEYVEDGDVMFDGETHDIDVNDEQDTDGSNGGKMTLRVVDTKMGNTRVYSFDPTRNALFFADDTTELAVVKNPDASYTVDGEPAANGKAAVALLKKHPVYADASAWGFIMTYSVCQSCLERAAMRAAISCEGLAREATGQAVCDVFRDLCDCAICDKVGKQACAKCQ